MTWRDDIARWVLFAALALVVGPLVMRLVILRGDVPHALERRFHVVTTVGAFAVIDAGIAAFVIRASNALQLPLPDLLYGDLEPFAEKTRFGIAFLVMTVGFAVVAALLVLAWVFDAVAAALPLAGAALAAGFAAGFAFFAFAFFAFLLTTSSQATSSRPSAARATPRALPIQ